MIFFLSQLPAPDGLGNKLWDNSPLTYILCVAIVVLAVTVRYIFNIYIKVQEERRLDDLETLKVLSSLSEILKNLMKDTDSGTEAVRRDIKDTRDSIEKKVDDLKNNLKV